MIALRAFLAGGIALWATGVSAATLIPLADDPGGQSAALSAEQWFRWSFLFDSVVDGGTPVTDTTGAFQNQKQIYPVLMIAGTSGGTATRAFSVQAGRPLMIPFINTGCIGDASDDPAINCKDDPRALQAMDIVDRLLLTIDGETLVDATGQDAVDAIEAEYRVDSGLFSDLVVAPNNWGGVPPRTYSESYATGYYAFVNLAPGLHELTYGGAIDSLGFSNLVTATITVAPIPLPAGLPLLSAGLIGLGAAARRRRSQA